MAQLLVDNFDTENNGVGALNYNSFANWTITDGTVDLIGNGSHDFYPGNGLYVDLDGSSSNAGVMTSKSSFTFAAGCRYELRYTLGGSTRGDTNTVTVTVGGETANHTLASGDGLVPFVLGFTPAVDTTTTVSFENNGGDNVGLILLVVELVCV